MFSVVDYLNHFKLHHTLIKNSDTSCCEPYYPVIMGYPDEVHAGIKQILNGSDPYMYMVTFTLDPSKVAYDDLKMIGKVEKYIHKILTSKSLSHIKDCKISYEIGKSDNPHWHVYANCDKCLKKDRFKVYIAKYGNVDISKSRTSNSESIDTYLSKQNPFLILKENGHNL